MHNLDSFPDISGSAMHGRLRIALFSGNYNMVRDGANKALNRLVEFLLDRGAAVRIYSPTIDRPAFDPVGDLVSVPSVPIPRRREYRLAAGLTAKLKEDIRRFRPTHFHLSAPDLLGIQAQAFARELEVPVVTSLHTRFESYLHYYGLGFLAPLLEWRLRRFYAASDYVLAPNAPMADALSAGGLGARVRVWGRGVDSNLFNPTRRNPAWRKAHGFSDDVAVVLFFGRLVREKGIDVFVKTVDELRRRDIALRPLIVGDGPERDWLAAQLPDAVFTGHLEGEALGNAVASADILINPSLTEAFGNVNLEAMASGVTVVSADVVSASSMICDRRSGLLVTPTDPVAYADAAEHLIREPSNRKIMALAAIAASAAFSWNEVLSTVLDLYLAIS